MATGRTYVFDVRTKRESLFNVTETGTFVGHRCRSVDLGGLMPGGKALEDDASVSYAHDHRDNVLGSQLGSTWKMEEFCEGLPTPLDASATFTSPNNGFAETLKAGYGDTFGAAGSSIVGSGSTTSTLDITTGHDVRFQPAQIGFVSTNSGPGGTAQLELFLTRKVIAGPPATLHLAWNLASIPSAATTVYNSETAAGLITGVGIDSHSIYAEVIGEDSRDQWKIRGCAPELDVVGEIDNLLVAQVNWKAGSAAVAAHGLTIGQTVPVGGGPKSVVRRIVYFGNATNTDSAATRGIAEVANLKFFPGLSNDSEEGGGVEGLYSLQQMRMTPRVEFEVTVIRNSPAWLAHFTDYAARQDKYFAVQYGTQVASNGRGGIVAFAIPRARMSAVPIRGAVGRFVSLKVTLSALPPLMYTGGTANRVKSPGLAAVA